MKQGVAKSLTRSAGAVVAPGLKMALNGLKTDVHRAQGLDNWQAFDEQRIRLLNILSKSQKKILLVSGDYHCAAMASPRARMTCYTYP